MVSWVEPTELERDLHLAAELGKSLLEKNQELEEAFHQLYQTNQDQAQEIQFLKQQLVASRESRNHQVCLYEQLQTTTQDLEAANHSLRKESHSAQLRVTSLQKLVDSLQTEVDELQQRLKMSRYPSPSNNEDKCNSLQNKHSLEASILTKCIANKFPGTSVVNEPQSQPPLSPQDVIPVYYTPPLTSFKEPQSTMDPICPAERLQAAKLEGNLNAACVTISALKARVVELEPWVSHAAELQAALIAERNCSDMITRGSFYPVSEDDCNVAGLWNSNDCVMEPMVHGDWVEGGVQNEFGGAGCWVHLGGWHRIVRPEAAALTQLDHAPSASLSNEKQEAIDKAVQETFPNENGTPHFTSLHRSHPAKGMDSNSAFPSASTAPVKGVASYKSTSTKPEPEYKALFKEIFHRIANVKEDRS